MSIHLMTKSFIGWKEHIVWLIFLCQCVNMHTSDLTVTIFWVL